MKNLLLVLGLFLSLAVCGQENTDHFFYVGTFTSEGAEGINLCVFDSENGDIQFVKTFKDIDNPSFLKITKDKKYLYAVSRTSPEVEKSGGYVVAYKIGERGDLQFLNKQISNGSGPCHIDVSADGKFAAIATYGGGTTSLYPIKENGLLERASTIIKNTGSGPNKSRQNEPHAHSIKFSPFGKSVYSADLGTDQLNIFRLEKGVLKKGEQEFVKMAPGAGPRHFEFHSNGKTMYVINELNSTISTIKKGKEGWNVVQNLSTLPNDFSGDSFCADIHISNDGKFLYGSNRGHNSIAVFEVDRGSEELAFLGAVHVEGNWPRNFAISPDGEWMLVANQKSGNISVFKIDKQSGMIQYAGKDIKLPAPVCIEFL